MVNTSTTYGKLILTMQENINSLLDNEENNKFRWSYIHKENVSVSEQNIINLKL